MKVKKSDQYAISAILLIVAAAVCYFIWKHYNDLETLERTFFGTHRPLLHLVLIIGVFLLAVGIVFIVLAFTTRK